MMYTTEVTLHRRLILIDIENIVGGGVSMPSQLHDAQSVITAAIGQRRDDQIVLGCGRLSIDVVGFEWKGPHRLVFRPGLDGADLELLEILETERVSERFAEIVLISGDGIFAEVISLLGLRADVTVVSRAEACSRRLRMAAKHMLDLDYVPNSSTEAA